jgi:hypothetical protein
MFKPCEPGGRTAVGFHPPSGNRRITVNAEPHARVGSHAVDEPGDLGVVRLVAEPMNSAGELTACRGRLRGSSQSPRAGRVGLFHGHGKPGAGGGTCDGSTSTKLYTGPDGPRVTVTANQWHTLKSVPAGGGTVYSQCPGQ